MCSNARSLSRKENIEMSAANAHMASFKKEKNRSNSDGFTKGRTRFIAYEFMAYGQDTMETYKN